MTRQWLTPKMPQVRLCIGTKLFTLRLFMVMSLCYFPRSIVGISDRSQSESPRGGSTDGFRDASLHFGYSDVMTSSFAPFLVLKLIYAGSRLIPPQNHCYGCFSSFRGSHSVQAPVVGAAWWCCVMRTRERQDVSRGCEARSFTWLQ
jgi:hypothetical protein